MPVEAILNEKDNDGWTIYEWDFGTRQILSVRVSPDGKSVAFAALVGENAYHGTIGEKK